MIPYLFESQMKIDFVPVTVTLKKFRKLRKTRPKSLTFSQQQMVTTITLKEMLGISLSLEIISYY